MQRAVVHANAQLAGEVIAESPLGKSSLVFGRFTRAQRQTILVVASPTPPFKRVRSFCHAQPHRQLACPCPILGRDQRAVTRCKDATPAPLCHRSSSRAHASRPQTPTGASPHASSQQCSFGNRTCPSNCSIADHFRVRERLRLIALISANCICRLIAREHVGGLLVIRNRR